MKNKIQLLKQISKNNKKIYFDILIEKIFYKTKIEEFLKYEFYLLNKTQKRTFLTKYNNKKLIKKYNNYKNIELLNNQDFFYKNFNEFLNRKILKKNFNKQELAEFLRNKSNVIAKLNDNSIFLKNDFNLIINEYNNYYIEEEIKQNKKICDIIGKNTILKIITLKKEKLNIIQAVLFFKYNNKNILVFLNEDGTVIAPATDENLNIYGTSPITKKQLLGFKIPFFKECIDLITAANKKVKDLNYLCWNIFISDVGPCLIKISAKPPILQMSPRFCKNKEGILKKLI